MMKMETVLVYALINIVNQKHSEVKPELFSQLDRGHGRFIHIQIYRKWQKCVS